MARDWRVSNQFVQRNIFPFASLTFTDVPLATSKVYSQIPTYMGRWQIRNLIHQSILLTRIWGTDHIKLAQNQRVSLPIISVISYNL
ncbi:hypothetical protein M434DRAFT_295184 [Hypoxylon sp. CO27-5]|nr:hypothetical protein M434DRAFT_295184 [Hypoxylon sp. CO27-5]